MNPHEYLKQQVEKHSINIKWLTGRCGFSEKAMFLRKLINGTSPIRPEHAVKIHKNTDGLIQAPLLHPEFFQELEEIGFKQSCDCGNNTTNSKTESKLNGGQA